MATVETPREAGADSSELAGFGYKQELDRSLGSFSSFAAGFSYISILTGVTALFGLGYLNAGPGVWWTWPVVVFGQILVALCFMEMAGQYPIAGSVYQWSKQVGGAFGSWMTGWIYIVGAIVTIAAVAIDWQVVLPQITHQIADPRQPRRRRPHEQQGRGAKRAAARRDPDRHHDNDQHARRQADGAHQQRRRGRRAGRLDAADHPAAVPPTPPAVGHRAQLRLRRRPFLGLLRRAADRRTAERVRDVRVRHRRDARRGDQQPAQARPAGDHPRDRRRGHDRRPGDPARDHVQQEHRRQEHRAARPALRDQERVRQHHRKRLPRRYRARDLRLLPGGAGGHDPDAVLDGARRPAAVRLAGRARVGSSQGADRSRAGDRHPRAGAAGDQRRQPERVLCDHRDRDHHVLPRLPRRDRPDAGRAVFAAPGRSPTMGRTSRSDAGGCR